MNKDDEIKLKILIQESEDRVYRHVKEVENRLTIGMIFLFVCILFPELLISILIIGLFFKLFFHILAAISNSIGWLWDKIVIDRVIKDN